MNAVSPPADPLVPQLQAVEKLIAERQLEEAAKRLNTLVREAPGDARIYLMGSRLAEAAGNRAGSVEACRRAVGVAPGWAVAVTELAMAHARANQFGEAIAQAEKAVQLEPENLSLLARVIDVAHRAQHLELAIAWLRRAIVLAPLNTEIQRMLARDLRLTGRHDESLAQYAALIEARPDDLAARHGRMQTALAKGDRALALADADALVQAMPDNAEYRFWQQVAQGQTPPRQPAEMVTAQYDSFAPLYDQHVVVTLKYKLPKLVGERILEWHPDRQLNLLDLGCGTGLLGAVLGRVQGALVGVDVSRPMLEEALLHGVYDKLHHVDLFDALESTPEGLYDVIAALDVFIYAGDVAQAAKDAHRILKPGGRFVFSCERSGDAEPDLVLRPTMRYAHKVAAIEAQCRAAGFAEVELESVIVHQEAGQPVEGFLVVARKAAA